MVKKKFNGTNYILITILVSIFIFMIYAVYLDHKSYDDRRKNFAVTIGKITASVPGSRRGRDYKYSFEASGTKKEGTVCCANRYETDLVEKPIIVVYELGNLENHRGLLTIQDFQLYKLTMPDSIHELYLYGKQLKY